MPTSYLGCTESVAEHTESLAPSPSATALLRRCVLAPAAVLLALAMLAIGGLAVAAAVSVNRVDFDNETRTLESLIRDLRDRLTTVLLDHGRRDEAVARLVEDPDPDWAGANFGQDFRHLFGLAAVGVLSPEHRLTHGATDRQAGGALDLAAVAARLAPSVAELRGAHLNARESRTGFVMIDGQLYLIGLTALIADRTAAGPSSEPPAILLLGQRIDAALLAELGSRFALDDLRLAPAEALPGSTAAVPLTGPDGRIVALATWRPDRPGDDLMLGLLPALAVLIGVAALLARRMAAAWRQALGLVRGTDRELRAIFEAAPHGIMVLDAHGVVRRLNPAAARIFDCPGDALVGRDARAMITIPDLGDAPAADRDWLARPCRVGPAERSHAADCAGDGQSYGREAVGLRLDGTRVPLELSVSPVDIGPVAFGLGDAGPADTGRGRWCVAMLRDMSERAAARHSLLQKARRAEAANRARTAFLAHMSHELRTPLNAIIGFSELIASGMFGPIGNDRYQIYTRDILDSGSHLLQIIDRILDLAVIEAGTGDLNEEIVEPARLVDEVIRIVAAEAARASLILKREIAASPPIRADRVKLRQILLSLLSNAVRFSVTGGRIVLRVGLASPEGIEFTVADGGIGMSPETLARLFQPAIRNGEGYVRSSDGVGLGLPLSKQLAELHGGQLRLASVPGEGTTATLWLPGDRIVNAWPFDRAAV